MAGHSKWSNIQHRKNAQDAKRGQLFTKLIRDITVSARSNADPVLNPRLRLAIKKALDANVERYKVDRAIQRASGSLEGNELEEVRYEGYGPGGVAIIVDTLTDNRNRTAAEVRYNFSKHGGNLGTAGSVAWLFSQRGVISLTEELNDTQLMELALETGAEDILGASGTIPARLLTTVDHFERVRSTLEQKAIAINQAEITWLPNTVVSLAVTLHDKIVALLEALEVLDDVQAVYSNY